MTAQIDLSESLYHTIKRLAEPFVDTPETVLRRCVEYYVAKHGAPGSLRAENKRNKPVSLTFFSELPPDLMLTRPISIKLNGREYEKKGLRWTTLLFDVVAQAAVHLKSKKKLKKMLLMNYTDGRSEKERGYRFIPEADLSVQDQDRDPNATWSAAFHIVRALGMKVEAVFMWDDDENALHPGKIGRLTPLI